MQQFTLGLAMTLAITLAIRSPHTVPHMSAEGIDCHQLPATAWAYDNMCFVSAYVVALTPLSGIVSDIQG